MINDVTEESNNKSRYIDELMSRIAELEEALQGTNTTVVQNTEESNVVQEQVDGSNAQNTEQSNVVQEQLQASRAQNTEQSNVQEHLQASNAQSTETVVVQEHIQASSAQLTTAPPSTPAEELQQNSAQNEPLNCDTTGDSEQSGAIASDVSVLRRELASKQAEIEQLKARLVTSAAGDAPGDAPGDTPGDAPGDAPNQHQNGDASTAEQTAGERPADTADSNVSALKSMLLTNFVPRL